MKNLLFLILIFLLNTGFVNSQTVNSDTEKGTTFIFVRHGEKADNTPNTNLSDVGNNRAKALSRILSKVKVDAIFTTPLNRTKQTAQYVAENNNLSIQTYDIDSNFAKMTDHLAQKYKGKTVLIVGHSNTLPINIARITNNKNQVIIPETEFDNLYIIQLNSDGNFTNLLQLKYGDE